MKALKFFRLLGQKSQFELSLETLIPSYRLSKLENGQAKPTPEELQKLADALKATPDVLQGDVSTAAFRARIETMVGVN